MTTIEKISEYRKDPAISQSRLVALSKGIGGYNAETDQDLYFNPKLHFDIGEAFDCKMTYPNEFDNIFHVSDIDYTKGSRSVIKMVYDMLTDEDNKELFRHRDKILEACNTEGFGGNWPDDRKVKEIVDKGQQYWNELLKSDGKKIFTKKDCDNVKRMAEMVRSHDFTSDLVEFQDHNVDRWKQLPVRFEYRGHKCKALLDEVLINNGPQITLNGIVIPENSVLPIDYKTIGDSVKAFPSSARRQRYDVQGAWYELALQMSFQPDVKILPMVFIVCSTKTNEPPLLYRLSQTDREIGRWGALYHNGSYVPFRGHYHMDAGIENVLDIDKPGYEQMLSILEQYELQQQFEIDYWIKESNGLIETKIW